MPFVVKGFLDCSILCKVRRSEQTLLRCHNVAVDLEIEKGITKTGAGATVATVQEEVGVRKTGRESRTGAESEGNSHILVYFIAGEKGACRRGKSFKVALA